MPGSTTRPMRRVKNSAGRQPAVESVINSGSPSFFVASWIRLATFTVWPCGPYLNFRWLSVLPTSLARVEADPHHQRPGQFAAPAGVQLRQLPSMAKAARTPRGMVGLLDGRRSTWRGCCRRRSRRSRRRARRCARVSRSIMSRSMWQVLCGLEPLGQGGEAAEVAEEHGDFFAAALEQVASRSNSRTRSAEELFELHPRPLGEPNEPGSPPRRPPAVAPSCGFERFDRAPLRKPELRPHAVETPPHVLLEAEDRRGHPHSISARLVTPRPECRGLRRTFFAGRRRGRASSGCSDGHAVRRNGAAGDRPRAVPQ